MKTSKKSRKGTKNKQKRAPNRPLMATAWALLALAVLAQSTLTDPSPIPPGGDLWIQELPPKRFYSIDDKISFNLEAYLAQVKNLGFRSNVSSSVLSTSLSLPYQLNGQRVVAGYDQTKKITNCKHFEKLGYEGQAVGFLGYAGLCGATGTQLVAIQINVVDFTKLKVLKTVDLAKDPKTANLGILGCQRLAISRVFGLQYVLCSVKKAQPAPKPSPSPSPSPSATSGSQAKTGLMGELRQTSKANDLVLIAASVQTGVLAFSKVTTSQKLKLTEKVKNSEKDTFGAVSGTRPHKVIIYSPSSATQTTSENILIVDTNYSTDGTFSAPVLTLTQKTSLKGLKTAKRPENRPKTGLKAQTTTYSFGANPAIIQSSAASNWPVTNPKTQTLLGVIGVESQTPTDTIFVNYYQKNFTDPKTGTIFTSRCQIQPSTTPKLTCSSTPTMLTASTPKTPKEAFIAIKSSSRFSQDVSGAEAKPSTSLDCIVATATNLTLGSLVKGKFNQISQKQLPAGFVDSKLDLGDLRATILNNRVYFSAIQQPSSFFVYNVVSGSLSPKESLEIAKGGVGDLVFAQAFKSESDDLVISLMGDSAAFGRTQAYQLGYSVTDKKKEILKISSTITTKDTLSQALSTPFHLKNALKIFRNGQKAENAQIGEKFNFRVNTNPAGNYYLNLSSRQFNGYTGERLDLPLYSTDFYGNGPMFSAKSSYPGNPALKTGFTGVLNIKRASPMADLKQYKKIDSFDKKDLVLSDENGSILAYRCSESAHHLKTNVTCLKVFGLDKTVLGDATELVEARSSFYQYIMVFRAKKAGSQNMVVFVKNDFSGQEIKENVVFAFNDDFVDASIRISGKKIGVYLIFGDPTNLGKTRLGVYQFDDGANVEVAGKQLEAVYGLDPELVCPKELKFFGGESLQLLIKSDCGLPGSTLKDPQTHIKRLYQYAVAQDGQNNDIATSVLLIKSVDLGAISEPLYCATEAFIHVADAKPAQNAAIVKSFYSGLGEDSALKIPLRELDAMDSASQLICDFNNNIVTLISTGKAPKTLKSNFDENRPKSQKNTISDPTEVPAGLKQVKTTQMISIINANHLESPNSRIRAIRHLKTPHTSFTSFYNIQSNQVTVYALDSTSSALYGYYSHLEVPDLNIDSFKLTKPGNYSISVELVGAGNTTLTSKLSINLAPFNRSGAISLSSGFQQYNLYQKQVSEQKVQLSKIIDYEGSVLDIQYQPANAPSGSGSGSSGGNQLVDIMYPSNEFWTVLRQDYHNGFEILADYAMTFTDTEIQIYAGRSNTTKIGKISNLQGVKYATLLSTHQNEAAFVIFLTKNDAEYSIGAIFKNGENQNKSTIIPINPNFGIEKITRSKFYYLNRDTRQPGQPHKFFMTWKSNQIDSFIGYTTVSVTVKGSEITGVEFLAPARVGFPGIISDYDVSYSFGEAYSDINVAPNALGTLKRGAILTVILENDPRVTFVAFERNEKTSELELIQRQTMAISNEAVDSISHQSSKLSCDNALIFDPANKQFEVRCFVTGAGRRSATFSGIVPRVSVIANTTSFTKSLQYTRVFYNLPNFEVSYCKISIDVIFVLLQRDPDAPQVSGSKVLNENVVIAVYKLDKGAFPIRVLTKDDLGVAEISTPRNVYIQTHRLEDLDHEKSHDVFLFVNVKDSSQKEYSELSGLSAASLEDNKGKLTAFSVEEDYAFIVTDYTKLDMNGDSFVVSSFEKDTKSFSLGQFFRVDDGRPKDGDTWLWVILIFGVLVLVCVGVGVYSVNLQRKQNLRQIEVAHVRETVLADTSDLSESEYTRL